MVRSGLAVFSGFGTINHDVFYRNAITVNKQLDWREEAAIIHDYKTINFEGWKEITLARKYTVLPLQEWSQALQQFT